jgi:RimJ/RimL family protein N-acetyltransferase
MLIDNYQREDSTMSNGEVCVVVGVGPGNGESFCRKFAGEGYEVAALARSGDKLEDLVGDIDGVTPYSQDATDAEEVERVGFVFGSIGERSRAGIGYWIASEYQGQGYGKTAVSFLLDHVYRVYPHPAIYAKVLPSNEASRGLLESLGFSQEGRLRKEAFWDGAYRDTLVYSLLREEWHQ